MYAWRSRRMSQTWAALLLLLALVLRVLGAGAELPLPERGIVGLRGDAPVVLRMSDRPEGALPRLADSPPAPPPSSSTVSIAPIRTNCRIIPLSVCSVAPIVRAHSPRGPPTSA